MADKSNVCRCNKTRVKSFSTRLRIHTLLNKEILGPKKHINGLPEDANINFMS